MYKYSLLFLTLLLFWSALAINGWLQHSHCTQLSSEIAKKNEATEQLFISPTALDALRKLEDLKKEAPVMGEFHDTMLSALNDVKFAKLKLGHEESDHAVIAKLPILSRVGFSRIERFKIRIPEGKKIEISANYSYTNAPGSNAAFKSLLPVGEYAVGIVSEELKSKKEKTFRTTVSSKMLPKPIVWEHTVLFRPNVGRGGRSFRGTPEITTESPVVLISKSHSKPSTNQQVDFVMQVKDVTDNE